MASRKDRRARAAKKRRSSAATRAPAGDSPAVAPAPARDKQAAGSRRAARRRGQAEPARRDAWRKAVEGAKDSSGPRPRGPLSRERPKAPWHPLPLSELVIVAGAAGVIVGLARGQSGGSTPLLAGLAAVALGTIEVTLREHLTGFRSHTLLLAFLPVVLFHSLAVLIVSLFTHVHRDLSIGLLVPDLALFAFLFQVLRVRFKDARRARGTTRRGTASS